MARAIGQVTKSGETYRGFLRFSGVRGEIALLPNAQKSTDRQPSHRVYFDGQEAGGGWLADAKDGMDYRSINCQIDDPSFPTPLRFALGRAPGQDDDDLFNLIWNRDAQQPQAAA